MKPVYIVGVDYGTGDDYSYCTILNTVTNRIVYSGTLLAVPWVRWCFIKLLGWLRLAVVCVETN